MIIGLTLKEHWSPVTSVKKKIILNKVIFPFIFRGYSLIFWLTELLALAYLFTLPGIQFPMIYELPIAVETPSYFYISNMIIHFYIYFIILNIVLFGDLFVIHYGLHFRCELQSIAEIIEKYLDDSQIVEKEMHLMKEVYEKHLQMLQMLKTLDDIYKHFSFNQLCTSFLCCCFLFYGTLVQEEFEGSLYMLNFIAITQLFALCLFGETLVANTEHLGIAFYHTKWYEMTTVEQKNILFMMQIAQRQHGIKAAGLINVNFFTFVEVNISLYFFHRILK